MTQDNKYNGWTNYETWLANLWYDNLWEDVAQDAWNSSDNADDCTREENAAFTLSNQIEADIEEMISQQIPKENGFVQDLVNSTLREINYLEIAKAYISEVDKDESEAA